MGATSQGFLRRQGTNIVNEAGHVFLRGVGLGNWLVNEAYLTGAPFDHEEWPAGLLDVLGTNSSVAEFYDVWRSNYVTQADIYFCKFLGYNSVRVPLDYHDFIEYTNGAPKSDGFVYLDQLLSWCRNAGIYAIPDMHVTPGGQRDPGMLFYDAWSQHILTNAWRYIAARYASNPWMGGYDLINEPVITNAADEFRLRALYVKTTAAIRSVDTNHLIFAEGNYYASSLWNLGPRWDNNMAFSIHNYWTPVPSEGISNQVALSVAADIPLWCGEFGENSNPWINAEKNDLEARGVGWSFWMYKICEDAPRFMLNVTRPPAYQTVLDYWHTNGPKPSVSEAYAGLMELARNTEFNRCARNKDNVDALSRFDWDWHTAPYTNHVIPGRIYAVDYDMGPQYWAYYDKVYQTTEQGMNFTAWNDFWLYRNDGVDIDDLWDGADLYIVGGIEQDEWLEFTVNTSGGRPVLAIRYAAAQDDCAMHVNLDDTNVTGSVSLPNTGDWFNWSSVTVTADRAMSAGTHKVRVVAESSGFNLDYIDFTGVVPMPPTGLQPTPRNNRIWLKWDAASGATNYLVKRSSTCGGPYTTIYSLPWTDYTDTTVTNGSMYYYVVSAVNSTGESTHSWQVLAQPDPPGVSVNAGGSNDAQFVEDAWFEGGAVTAVSSSIATEGLVCPASESVYQTVRYGDATYTFTGLAARADYVVRLHFAEFLRTNVQQRAFHAFVNDTQVLRDFDIFAAAGRTNKAVIQEFVATASTNGKIVVRFEGTVDSAKVSGIEILPGPPAADNNLAMNRPVTSSSQEDSGAEADKAVDTKVETRWSSLFSDPQWIMVDLGVVYRVHRVRLVWEIAYGKAYEVQVSTDGSNWTAAYLITNGHGMVDDLTFPATAARYVRMYGTQRGTEWGYSLWEFEVYGASVTPPGWIDRDIGHPGVVGSGNFNVSNGVWTVAGSGADVWGTNDQFRFLSGDLAGDGSLVARIDSLQDTDAIWSKSGVMFRESTAPNARFAFVFATPGAGIWFQSRNEVGAFAGTAGYVSGSVPVWVKLTRFGDVFRGFYGLDGVTWTELGPAQAIAMSANVKVGLAVTAHNDYDLNQSEFSCIGLLPAGWTNCDIGAVEQPGGALYGTSSGRWTLLGSGGDIWGTNDAFQFVYRTLPGDGAVSAYVTGQQDTDPWAKAGVMIRSGLEAGAAHAMMCLTPDMSANFQWRSSANGESSGTGSTGIQAPYWVRIERTGTNLTGYVSSNGVMWVPVGTARIVMGSACIGLAVSAHNNQTLGTVTVEQVSFTFTPPPSPSNLTAMAGDGSVALNWSESYGASTYHVKRGLVDGGPYTTLMATVASTSCIDLAVGNGTSYFYVVSAVGPDAESADSAQAVATPMSAFQAWQVLYFGSITNEQAAADTDADDDGVENLLEYLADTDPTNRASCFQITSMVREGDALRVNWTGGRGRTSVLQAAAGIAGSYSNRGVVVMGGPGVATGQYLVADAFAESVDAAMDDASDVAYPWGNFHGTNGGSGFEAWALVPTNNLANSGWYLGSSTNNGNRPSGGIDSDGKAWAAWADHGATASATRAFSSGCMKVGQTFSVDMDNGWIEASNSVGVALQNASSQNLVEVVYVGFSSQASYSVNDGTGQHSLDAPYTDGGVHIEVTLTVSTGYQARVTPAGNPTATNEGPLANPTGGQGVSQVRLFNGSAAGTNYGGAWDVFWNHLEVSGMTNTPGRFFRVELEPRW